MTDDGAWLGRFACRRCEGGGGIAGQEKPFATEYSLVHLVLVRRRNVSGCTELIPRARDYVLDGHEMIAMRASVNFVVVNMMVECAVVLDVVR